MTFQVLGMTAESERVYTALVRNPHRSSTELAAICDLPTAAVGRLLSKLVEDGLVTRTTGRPPRFTAAAPDTAVTHLISERERELGEARALVHRLAEMHREATRINDPAIAVELLSNRDDVSAAARRLSAIAQHQVRAFDRPPYVDRPGSNLGGQIQRQKEGVAHRVVYDRTAVAWPRRLQDDIIPSLRAGEQSRVHPELPLKIVIADDRTAIIPFSLAPGGQTAAYLIHQSPLLAALEALFETYWERATPVQDLDGEGSPDADRPRADEPDEGTRALLTLLAAGLTDASIARAQGWSERTTQRRVQQLMSSLGAVTRFQASLLAAKRGWL
jgi:DNA-binding NarL/FixJ family response regulator/DNA-binding Lrp family transcriptional regulator